MKKTVSEELEFIPWAKFVKDPSKYDGDYLKPEYGSLQGLSLKNEMILIDTGTDPEENPLRFHVSEIDRLLVIALALVAEEFKLTKRDRENILYLLDNETCDLERTPDAGF